MREVVRFRDVDIVFGDRPKQALPLIDRGEDRATIQEATGQVLGVAGCTLDVHEGEIVVLMGLSGSGKSTLLRAVNGLNPVVRGTVEVAAEDGWVDPHSCDRRTLRRLRQERVAMVFQAFGLLPWRTVRDNVAFGMEIAGVPAERRRERVDEQIALVGLDGWAERRVHELSGGMQQRVGLARAFATQAPILLMDEPFSALDPLIREKLQDDLLDLQARLKRTIVFVSHDLDEALKLGQRIAIMEGGRIVQVGRARDIVASPATDYVREFVGSVDRAAVLTAGDVMSDVMSGATSEAAGMGSGPSVAFETPLRAVMAALNGAERLGVERDGRIVGQVTAADVVRALAPA